MNTPDLETRIRAYYRTCDPADSARLMLASRTLLDEARRPRQSRVVGRVWRIAAGFAVAAILVAVLVLPRFGSAIAPAASASFDPAAAPKASADAAGLMRSGGIWAISGNYLLTSTDNGASWRAGNVPAGFQDGPVSVVDSNHAWLIDSSFAASVSSNASQTPTAWQLTISRTTDGGTTWQQVRVSGTFDCSLDALEFVDVEHGFLMCAAGAQPDSTSPNGNVPASKGSATLLRTVDGGATWQVMSHAVGLGENFTASDPNTVWSSEDLGSSTLDGVALHVSRDAGATWSTVDLPEAASLPVGPATDINGGEAGVAGGPTFTDASRGAFAVVVTSLHDPQTLWFYSTTDAGRSWTLVKKQIQISESSDPIARLGHEWALTGMKAPTGLTVSGDSGASWTYVPGLGLPETSEIHPLFSWVDFTDQSHAAALINYLAGAVTGNYLMLSSDGGITWHPSDFGNVKARVPANAAIDPATAQNTVNAFEGNARRDPAAPYAAEDTLRAWGMLSPYSQAAFGSMPAFESAETPNTGLRQPGDAKRGTDVLSEKNLGASLWKDLNASADMSRAYVVTMSFPGASLAPETLVVAPLAATGEWRVWVVVTP
jgi:hypothetical protein